MSTTAINDGAWHQCVATWQQGGGALTLYVDGNLEATGTGGTNAPTAPTYLRFGSLQTGTNFFAGSLDDIRMYNRALGNNEVTALYDNSAVLPAAPSSLTAMGAYKVVGLNWGESSLGTTSYIVSRSTTSGGPYTAIGTTPTSLLIRTLEPLS